MMKSLPFSLALCYKLHSLNEPQTLAEELKASDRLEMVSPSLIFVREKNILWKSATFSHQRMYKTSCCLSSNFRHPAQQDHPPSSLRGLGIWQKPINNWNHSKLPPRNKYMLYLVSWWEKGKKGQQLLLPYYKITGKLPRRGSLWQRKGHIKASSGLSAWRVGTPESPPPSPVAAMKAREPLFAVRRDISTQFPAKIAMVFCLWYKRMRSYWKMKLAEVPSVQSRKDCGVEGTLQ